MLSIKYMTETENLSEGQNEALHDVMRSVALSTEGNLYAYNLKESASKPHKADS